MLLKLGSKGEEVKKLQQKLAITADGIFGAQTAIKVQDWQRKNGLVADGIVGDLTWKALFEETGCKVSNDLSWLNSQFNFAPLSNLLPSFVFNQISQISEKFSINSNLRLAHFLGQCAHESANFKLVEENLNYSAAGLLRVFAKYFDAESAQKFSMQPQKIASRVYANRMGNGDEASNEGYKFRGRGYIQLTGKANYAKFSADFAVDCVANPDLVASQFPLASAAWFFAQNNLNQIADLGEGDGVVKKITLKINGGTNGLKDRIEQVKKFYQILNG